MKSYFTLRYFLFFFGQSYYIFGEVTTSDVLEILPEEIFPLANMFGQGTYYQHLQDPTLAQFQYDDLTTTDSLADDIDVLPKTYKKAKKKLKPKKNGGKKGSRRSRNNFIKTEIRESKTKSTILNDTYSSYERIIPKPVKPLDIIVHIKMAE